ncbi:hypothetical protein [Flagellimonas algicola]|uniref:Secreted protein n=1 Tax=Flagellimonas algicola TaxID=2583815 RepID=A0ABY2WNZ0_9FLAO|nr:hypothetical protein [Allomuricauda algicola]TMU56455.1 hypothetical protein FGG15_02640 [Allomuricauda algicola]
MKNTIKNGLFLMLFGTMLLMACSSSKSDDYEPPRDEEEAREQMVADSLSAIQNSSGVKN